MTERVLVFAGFAQVLSVIVVYTGKQAYEYLASPLVTDCPGGCRGGYINVCLAHLISKLIMMNEAWC